MSGTGDSKFDYFFVELPVDEKSLSGEVAMETYIGIVGEDDSGFFFMPMLIALVQWEMKDGERYLIPIEFDKLNMTKLYLDAVGMKMLRDYSELVAELNKTKEFHIDLTVAEFSASIPDFPDISGDE